MVAERIFVFFAWLLVTLIAIPFMFALRLMWWGDFWDAIDDLGDEKKSMVLRYGPLILYALAAVAWSAYQAFFVS